MTSLLDPKRLLDAGQSAPPVCEFQDWVAAGLLTWHDPTDEACGGRGAWLLVSTNGDLPSPLCDKHAQIVEDRIGHLFERFRMQLVQS